MDFNAIWQCSLIGCAVIPVALGFCLGTAECQEPTAAVLPVAVPVVYDAANRKITFGLQNDGRNEITAFEYSIRVVNSAGQTFFDSGGTDALHIFSIRSLGPVNSPGALSFRPGEVYHESRFVPLAWGDVAESGIAVRAVAVIYEDCAWSGDQAWVDRVFALRQAEARKGNQVLAEVARLPRDAEFAGRIRQVAARFRPGGSNDTYRQDLLRAISEAHGSLGFAGVDAILRTYNAQLVADRTCQGRKGN